MQPLGTKVYLLKRYSPSDSFCTFFSLVDIIAKLLIVSRMSVGELQNQVLADITQSVF